MGLRDRVDFITAENPSPRTPPPGGVSAFRRLLDPCIQRRYRQPSYFRRHPTDWDQLCYSFGMLISVSPDRIGVSATPGPAPLRAACWHRNSVGRISLHSLTIGFVL